MADEAETIQIGEAAIDHLITITAPPLVLEVYSEDLYRDDFDWLQKLKSVLFRLRPLWRRFYGILQEENIPQDLGLSLEGGQQWEVDLNFVSNETIRRLNREFRNKDAATDVLSFTLLADSPIRSQLVQLETVQLGAVYISLEWAVEAVRAAVADSNNFDPDGFDPLDAYVLERIVHGFLHLLGINHDTMREYNRVIAIQKRVLDEAHESDPG